MELDIETKILSLNKHAMILLTDQKFESSLRALKEAADLINFIKTPKSKTALQGITFNNFGCFYKRAKMPKVALEFLKKACFKEKDRVEDGTSLAATHLNMCTIYSELGEHEVALGESLKSLELLKNVVDNSNNFVSTLVIAYYNTGVQYEFLKRFGKALEYYRLAWETAFGYLGVDDSLTVSMEENYLKAERSLKEKEMRNTRIESSNSNLFKLPKSRPQSAKKHPQSAKKRPQSSEVFLPKTSSKDFTSSTQSKFFPYDSNLDLKKVRFLTGDRMQPMYKSTQKVQSAPRNRPLQVSFKSQKHENLRLNSKVIAIIQGKDKNSECSSVKPIISNFDNGENIERERFESSSNSLEMIERQNSESKSKIEEKDKHESVELSFISSEKFEDYKVLNEKTENFNEMDLEIKLPVDSSFLEKIGKRLLGRKEEAVKKEIDIKSFISRRAEMKIQKAIGEFILKKRLLRIQAAIKIQKVFRGYKKRKQLEAGKRDIRPNLIREFGEPEKLEIQITPLNDGSNLKACPDY